MAKNKIHFVQNLILITFMKKGGDFRGSFPPLSPKLEGRSLPINVAYFNGLRLFYHMIFIKRSQDF